MVYFASRQIPTSMNTLVLRCLFLINTPGRFLFHAWTALILICSVFLKLDIKPYLCLSRWLSPLRILLCNQPSCWTLKLSLTNHFLNALKLLLTFLAYQQFPLRFVLFVVSGCPQSNLKYYLNQTQDKIVVHIWSPLLFTQPLISFPVSNGSWGGKSQASFYFSDQLMRMAYAFQHFPEIKTLFRCGQISSSQCIHTLTDPKQQRWGREEEYLFVVFYNHRLPSLIVNHKFCTRLRWRCK